MVVLFVVIFGLIAGSFCNAAVWRIHIRSQLTANSKQLGGKRKAESGKRFSLLNGRSVCETCKHELAPIDLIPLFSWLWLRGKCRYCQAPISIQNPLLEILAAGIFVALYLSIQPGAPLEWATFIFWCVISVGLVILTVYDLYWLLLPDVIVFPLIAITAVWLVATALITHSTGFLFGAVLAALAAGGSFYLLAAVSKGRWMGGGDIKLVFLMGLLLGPSKTGVALILAFYSAAIISVGLLLLRIKKRSDHIPFGPFLIAATLVSFIYGEWLIHLYMRITGLALLIK